MAREFKLETPTEIQRRQAEGLTKDIRDFGKAHPSEWFIAYQQPPGKDHRPVPRCFLGAFWERKYRTKIENGKTIKLSYLRYVGPT